MHIFFSDDEKTWMDMNVFGCPIKKGCPKELKESIEKKKKQLGLQKNHGKL